MKDRCQLPCLEVEANVLSTFCTFHNKGFAGATSAQRYRLSLRRISAQPRRPGLLAARSSLLLSLGTLSICPTQLVLYYR